MEPDERILPAEASDDVAEASYDDVDSAVEPAAQPIQSFIVAAVSVRYGVDEDGVEVWHPTGTVLEMTSDEANSFASGALMLVASAETVELRD